MIFFDKDMLEKIRHFANLAENSACMTPVDEKDACDPDHAQSICELIQDVQIRSIDILDRFSQIGIFPKPRILKEIKGIHHAI